MENNFEDRGIILKKTLIKEKWAFFTIFTYKSWKKSFFVSNIKKSKNIFSSYLAIWSEIFFKFSNRNRTSYLKEVKIIKTAQAIWYQQLIVLSYVLKLSDLMNALDQSNTEFYLLLTNSINSLINNKSLVRICLSFEIKLLTILWFLNKLNVYINSNEKIDLSLENFLSGQQWWIIKSEQIKILIWNLPDEIWNDKNENDLILLIWNEIKILYFMQCWKYDDIFKIKISFSFFKKNQFTFRKIILEHLPTKIDINPCFLSENMIE